MLGSYNGGLIKQSLFFLFVYAWVTPVGIGDSGLFDGLRRGPALHKLWGSGLVIGTCMGGEKSIHVGRQQ